MTRLPAIEAFQHCNLCPPRPQVCESERPLAVGFGQVTVTADTELVWSGDDPTLTMSDAESWATEDPEADWRVTFHAPLYEATYQRQAEATWVLVGRGEGFA